MLAAQAIFAGCLADELPELAGHVNLARPATLPRARVGNGPKSIFLSLFPDARHSEGKVIRKI